MPAIAFRSLFLTIILLCCQHAQAQYAAVRGVVRDADTRGTLPGATVRLLQDTVMISGSITGSDGTFRFDKVNPGRYTLHISYIGYRDQVLPGLVHTSAKELVVEAELKPSVTEMQAVEIQGNLRDRNDEMALISNRTFNVEETERYAGSRGDPARMAANFAGVQGNDDSRNDIVIRGNSPAGVLYRLEGMDIPNPNHFAVAGTMGGPVSIINNKTLANSDFYMSAFPARYGNAVAGIFDLKMRQGNNEQHEFSGQFGFLGTELTAEGPLDSAGRTSWLGNFRYSTLKLFEAVNFKIGTEAIPAYRDGAFKIHRKTRNGSIELFGLGGTSSIDIVVSTLENPLEEIYGDKNRDQYFGTGMGVAGLSFNRTIGSNSFLKVVTGVSLSESHTYHELVRWNLQGAVDSLIPLLGYQLTEYRGHLNIYYTVRTGSRHLWNAGLINTYLQVDYRDTLRSMQDYQYKTRLDAEDRTGLVQAFLQWKYSLSERTALTAGMHGMYFALNGSYSAEPRLSFRHDINRRHAVSLGAGLHSQLLPVYIYYHQEEDISAPQPHNQDADLIRAVHSVAGYEYARDSRFRLRAEVYGQYLYHVPVEIQPSAFSMLNQGTGFARLFPDAMKNTGDGVNFGIELTGERTFSKSFYLLGTVSLYESRYRGSDMVWRDTDFNGNYIVNLLAGKELKTGKKSLIQLGIRNALAGGRRYGPVDIPASAVKGETVYVDDETNSLQFRPYLRTDIKILYRLNSKKVTHELGLDLVNVFNVKNILALSYIPDPANPAAYPVREEYQLGFLPLFYYRIDI